MASFTNNNSHSRHRSYYDREDARNALSERGAYMKQVPSSRAPDDNRPRVRVRSGYSSKNFVRNPETEAITQRRVNEGSRRARDNWSLAKGAVSGASAMKQSGTRRAERRPASGWSNPVGMVREALGGPRTVSPRSKEARKVAVAAANTKRSAHSRGTEGRRRAEQDGKVISYHGRQRAHKKMRQKHTLRDDMRALANELVNREGYYYGTIRDQYFQKMLEEAGRELGDSANEQEVHQLAQYYYDEKYHPRRNRTSRSSSRPSSSSGSRSSSTSSRPSHGGPAPLSIPQEMLDRSDHPNWFLCPITMELMTDPVILSSGQTYERSAITAHLRRNNKDPVTNAKLRNKNVTPNMALRHSIMAHLARLSSGSGNGSSMSTQTSPRVQDRGASGPSKSSLSKKERAAKHAKAAEKRKSQKKKGKRRGGRRKTKRRRSSHKKRTRRKRKKARKTKRR